jgi:hypothetical protein
MYSNEDQIMTADQLAAIPTSNALGRFHNPVGYGEFLDLIKHRLQRAGLDILNEEYVTANEGQRFFGTMELGVDGLQSEGMSITLGVRGSHDQSVPRAVCLGNRVMVCSNLEFGGDLANLSTKQTTNIWRRLPGLVDQAIDRIPAMAERQVRRAHALQEHTFNSPRHGDAALVEIHRRGGLTPAQLGRAIGEWDSPSYEEHDAFGDSAWKLLQACTEAQKPTGQTCSMDLVRERTAIAGSFIDSVVGIDW